MKRFLIAGAAGAALIASAAAIAQPAAHGQDRGDRVQTRAEVQAKVAQRFARLDTNRDGFVTQAETQALRANRAGKRGDRRAERGGAAFDRLDANRDGMLSRAEFEAGRAVRQQRVASRDGNGDGRPDARRMRGGNRFAALQGRMFEMSDANRDGRVSLQEATGAALQRFDRADANRDGQVTREERIQMREQRRAQPGRG